MLMQHIGVGYFGYYRATAYAMKHSLMPEIAGNGANLLI